MDRLDELKRQIESFSEHELAEFRAWFDSYDGDFATAERRYAALKPFSRFGSFCISISIL